MTITERLMGVGSWELKLRPDTPRTVMDRLDVRRAGFGHIVATSSRVNVEAMSDAGILSVARYTGVYRKQPSEFGMAGAGVNMWVSDEDGKGPSFAGRLSTTNGLFSEWVAELSPSQLASGITSTIAGSFEKWYHRVGIREPLDEICGYFGAEWRVTNDLKFDIGTPGDLFNLTPRAVILRRNGEGGRDLNVTGVVGDLDVTRDLEEWTRRVVYYTNTEDAPIIDTDNGGVADADVPFRGPNGAAIILDRLVENFGDTSGFGAGLAAAEYKATKDPHQELRLSTGQYDIGQDVRVGDNVYVYDPTRGIQDLSTQLAYRGRTIFPETIRCVGLSWPVRQGMGVYFRYYTKPSTTWVVNWLDLTNYVDWETGDTEVEVGAKPRTI